MRCQPLSRALCLIILKQWVMVFLCSLGWLVSRLSASWLFWALFFGHLFFGARNSENCLIQFSGNREVRAVGSIKILILGLFVLAAKAPSLIFKMMSHFSFWLFGFCSWVKVELILVLAKHKSLKLKHNKRFKRDSQRVAFLPCVGFCDYDVMGKVGRGVGCPLSGRYATQVNLGVQSF